MYSLFPSETHHVSSLMPVHPRVPCYKVSSTVVFRVQGLTEVSVELLPAGSAQTYDGHLHFIHVLDRSIHLLTLIMSPSHIQVVFAEHFCASR